MKKCIKEKIEYVNNLKTVEAWKTGCMVYGVVMTAKAGVVTLPLVVVAGAAEAGYKKTKEHIEHKQAERFEVLMEQYNKHMNTTTVGL